MKKFLLTLGLLAAAGILNPAAADGRKGAPWNSPLITGDPKLNPDIRRPGPYTPKPKPTGSSASVSGNILSVAEGTIGMVSLDIEDMGSGQHFSVILFAGDTIEIPETEEGSIVTVYLDGKMVDSMML